MCTTLLTKQVSMDLKPKGASKQRRGKKRKRSIKFKPKGASRRRRDKKRKNEHKTNYAVNEKNITKTFTPNTLLIDKLYIKEKILIENIYDRHIMNGKNKRTILMKEDNITITTETQDNRNQHINKENIIIENHNLSIIINPYDNMTNHEKLKILDDIKSSNILKHKIPETKEEQEELLHELNSYSTTEFNNFFGKDLIEIAQNLSLEPFNDIELYEDMNDIRGILDN